ncbi:MAG TPA: glycoside hydrolase family 43 protein [Candidatus Hydrogenedentes bacterium]|nr:glycoside hydrolase family 43 protein [Candidatus Hydrogenedentota bacterium]HOK89964.1 glycoside hydrolase family 43 protein [Candidatus Hydrogenedentota bacterium]
MRGMISGNIGRGRGAVRAPSISLWVILAGLIAAMTTNAAEPASSQDTLIKRGDSLALSDIWIRDPFVLPVPESGWYYLYGTASEFSGKAPLLCYRSRDLKTWSGPISIFTPPPGFWGEVQFWAPEVHRWRGKYYLFATFAKPNNAARGTHVCVADSPEGPFLPLGDGPQTPRDWLALDGTLYVDEAGKPWMVFCHEWLQVKDGEIQAIPLSEDLGRAIGEPRLLFRASEAPWVIQQPDKVTDGPFLHRTASGALLMLWSSFGHDGLYKLGLARSVSGKLEGPWTHEKSPLVRNDGGHGMLFRDFSGRLMACFHQPNRHPSVPRIVPVREEQDTIRLEWDNTRPPGPTDGKHAP